MTLVPNTRQPLRYHCGHCGCEVARPALRVAPPPVVDCPSCGALCALTRPGQSSRVPDATPTVKVVPTGMSAVMRHV